ncbi:MAG: NAD(P)H-dependent oxidoreductase [Rhizobiaceae bacterium]
MPSTLIVLAHPELGSFNGQWAQASADACRLEGDTVLTSNLVQMGFNPVEERHHYSNLESSQLFDPLKAQETASTNHNLPVDVITEVDKMRRADRIILHFPIWWFAPPAVLKGWLDRVFVHGKTHSVDERFDQGHFRGKKVLFCVTTGSQASESAFNGKEGDIQMLLWPLAYAFRYLGFSALVPQVVHGVHGYHSGPRLEDLQSRLSQVIASQKTIITDWNLLPELQFNSDTEFDDQGRLKTECTSHSYFIRHEPRAGK